MAENMEDAVWAELTEGFHLQGRREKGNKRRSSSLINHLLSMLTVWLLEPNVFPCRDSQKRTHF